MKKLFLLSALCPTTLAIAAPAATPQPKINAAAASKAAAKPTAAKPTAAKPAVLKTPVATPPIAKPAIAKTAAKPAIAGQKLLPALASTLKKLPNGVVFVARPDNLAPRAAISLVIGTGAADETPETAGWRRVLVNAMLRGAPQGVASETALSIMPAGEGLPRAAEKLGGRIGATVGDDFVEIFVVGDAKRAPELLDLALALWKKPRLSDADIQSARERAQSQVEADDLDTAGKTQAALRSQLFRTARGDLAAYGLSEYGTALSLEKLTEARLRTLHTSKLAAARLTVAATGNFDAAALQRRLAALPASTARPTIAPSFAAPKASAPALIVRELPVPSAWVFVSYPLAGNTHSDAPALRVLAAALGDSSKARLPGRLLENQPIGSSPPAISVAAQFVPRRFAGEMVLFSQTSPQNVERVKNAMLDEMRRLREAPLSKLELESAKTYARGSWSVERQNLRDRAFQTALSPALGGPLDTLWPSRLSAVSGAEVQRVAKKYLRAYAVALVMPAE